MTPEIALSLTILGLTVVLFISERIRVDLIALIVLVTLAVTGLVTAEDALSGFSNAAVVTVWAVFILSGALSRTGIANLLGRQVLKIAGDGEVRLLVIIMLTAGGLSAFMNNIGVVAMLLPVVIDIARRTQRPPSKLLIPLTFGSLLGGMMTLISTPTNILVSNALIATGEQGFEFFDFAPVGFILMLTGIVYMAVIGRKLLPERDLTQELREGQSQDPGSTFALEERLFVLHLPPDSALDGKTLAESRLGSALRLNVISILHNGESQLAPDPQAVLHSGDRLLVSGRTDRLSELGSRKAVDVDGAAFENITVKNLTSTEVNLAEVRLHPTSEFNGKTLQEIDFRRHYGAIVLAVRRKGVPHRTDIQELALQAQDVLLIQATPRQIRLLEESKHFQVSTSDETEQYHLDERLHLIRIPQGSSLAGKTLEESNLGASFGLGVMGIIRGEETILMVAPEEILEVGDQLLVKGKLEDLYVLEGLQNLQVEEDIGEILEKLETESVGLVEVVLSPRTTLAGKTLRQIHFREKYGLSVLAVWRGGRAHRHNLRNFPLRFGDALLVYGLRSRMRVLAADADFITLDQNVQIPPRLDKAPLAALIMGGVVLTAGLGWLPIAIAAIAGSILMVLSGCLRMDEAYESIEWQAVFLIAGLLPLGLALENSGAARYLANGVINGLGPLGPMALLGGMFLLTMLASQVMPNPVVTVLMAPIALNTAADMNFSPYALMMVVAIAASTTFLSPVGHPANILIMGPGGYRFKDYIRVGLPLTVVLFVVSMIVLPIFWPLIP